MRIIFMGTPDFAIPSLRILVDQGYDVAAVVTAPDRPAGRGRKLRPSPVKVYAESQKLEVLQPEKLRAPAFRERLEALAPDLMVVVAFRMLPEVIWSLPRLGTINLHASLLPDYRGAAPINWAIVNGEKETGLTTFFIDKQIDTGSILMQAVVPIPDDATAGDLHDHMMEAGAALVLETVRGLEAGTLTSKPQDDAPAKNRAPKIFREDCRIDWAQPAGRVHDFIRGLSPWPGAWTMADDKVLKLYRARPARDVDALAGGATLTAKDALYIGCGEGAIEVLELQLEGKKRMPAADFLKGNQGGLPDVR